MTPSISGMIFAAGVGSRLKPWTDSHPKALVEVAGRPVISLVIDRFLAAGIRHIVINVHHFASQIVDYVSHAYAGCDISFSDESDILLDTGGGLRKALPLLGDSPVLIHNADILTDFPLESLIDTHLSGGADATLTVSRRTTSRYFVFDGLRLVGWTDIRNGRVRPDGLVLSDALSLRSFDGVHIVSSSLFAGLRDFRPDGVPFSIVDYYLSCCPTADIRGFERSDSSRWFDVGKPETLEAARRGFSL